MMVGVPLFMALTPKSAANLPLTFAGACTGVLALAAFLLDYVGRLWKPAETLGWFSPFRYYSPFDMVTGAGLSMKNVVVLGSIAVAGYVAAYILFSRRDLSH